MNKTPVARFALVVVLTLCVAAVSLTATAAAPVPAPGLQLPDRAGLLYLADRNAGPGVVLCVLPTGELKVLIRPANNLTSFTFGRTPRGLQAEPGVMSLIFSNGISQKSLWRATSPVAEALLLTVAEYVREVAFGPGSSLYFSHSYGAGADGKIMALAGAAPTLYTQIERAKIGGFWAGNFAFDPYGKLYVSNGNIAKARIWRYTTGASPAASQVFKTTGSILGFWFTDAKNFLYTDGSGKVLKGHLGGDGPDGVAYENPARKFCDVVVR